VTWNPRQLARLVYIGAVVAQELPRRWIVQQDARLAQDPQRQFVDTLDLIGLQYVEAQLSAAGIRPQMTFHYLLLENRLFV
jgi:hypothetical protein